MFPISFSIEQKNFGTCCMCKTEEVSKLKHDRHIRQRANCSEGSVQKGRKTWSPHSRWKLHRCGRREIGEHKKTRPQKRLETWLDCDTCPSVVGDFYWSGLWCVIMLPVVSWASTLSACTVLFCMEEIKGHGDCERARPHFGLSLGL